MNDLKMILDLERTKRSDLVKLRTKSLKKIKKLEEEIDLLKREIVTEESIEKSDERVRALYKSVSILEEHGLNSSESGGCYEFRYTPQGPFDSNGNLYSYNPSSGLYDK